MRARRSLLVALALAAASASCSHAPPPPAHAPGPLVVRDLEPSELVPDDLDLVVRIDLARMRDAFGPLAAKDWADQAAARTSDPILASVLACADVAWIGLRLGETDLGDHVAVFEGRDCNPEVDLSAWKKTPSPNGKIEVFDRQGPTQRGGTARILFVGAKLVALVSPTEVDSVQRLVVTGADHEHGEPYAEGLVSLDLRTHRLPPSLEKRYKAIAAIVAGIERAHAAVDVADDGVRLEAEIRGTDPQAAEKVVTFVAALRDNVQEPTMREVTSKLVLERVDKTVHVRWTLPRNVVVALLGSGPARKPPPPGSKPGAGGG